MTRKKLPPGVVHARRLAYARKWRKKNKEWVSLYNAGYFIEEVDSIMVRRHEKRMADKAQRKKRASK